MAERKIEVSLSGNSYAEREQEAEENIYRKTRPRVEKVVDKNKIVRSKKTFVKKAFETFVEEDVEDIKSYVIFDMLIPGLKNGIVDMIETAFFGQARRNRGRDGRYTPYGSYYRSTNYGSRYDSSYGRRGDRDRDRDRDRRKDDHKRRDDDRYMPEHEKVDYRNIVLRERRDAEMIVSKIHERIEEYDACSVAEFLDMLDISSDFVLNNWGWTDTRDVGVRRVTGGFLVDVTEARYLD